MPAGEDEPKGAQRMNAVRSYVAMSVIKDRHERDKRTRASPAGKKVGNVGVVDDWQSDDSDDVPHSNGAASPSTNAQAGASARSMQSDDAVDQDGAAEDDLSKITLLPGTEGGGTNAKAVKNERQSPEQAGGTGSGGTAGSVSSGVLGQALPVIDCSECKKAFEVPLPVRDFDLRLEHRLERGDPPPTEAEKKLYLHPEASLPGRFRRDSKAAMKIQGWFRGMVSRRKRDTIAAGKYANVILPDRACWICPLDAPIRRMAITILQHPHFENFVTCCIILNCLFMVADDPYDRKCCSDTSPTVAVLEYAEYVFLGIFTSEMLVKMLAMGVLVTNAKRGEVGYLNDSWNWLDFLVVIMSWVEVIARLSKASTGAGNLSSLRFFRILKPLRTMNSFPGMRKIVETLIVSLPKLADVCLLVAFIFMVFGIVALQFWQTTMMMRCYHNATGALNMDDYEAGDLCSPRGGSMFYDHTDARYVEFTPNAGVRFCGDGQFCGLSREAPNNDVTKFADILYSFLAIFQIVTLEGWTDILYALQDTFGGWFPAVYMIFLVCFGSFLGTPFVAALFNHVCLSTHTVSVLLALN